jgi:tetratricopeptide (TPR) repeat protein
MGGSSLLIGGPGVRALWIESKARREGGDSAIVMERVQGSATVPASLRGLAWIICLAGFAVAAGCNNFSATATNVDGVRLYERGDYQAAMQRFGQALAYDPTDADGYYNLAVTRHRLGKISAQEQEFRQAESLYNQCLDRDPNHVDCYRGLAVLLVDTKRQDAAVRLLEGWSQRSPTSAEPKIELARLHQDLGDRATAARKLEEAVSIEPYNARALTALGHLRESSGDIAQALANYQRSLAVNQQQPQVAARVAALQGVASQPATSPPGDTRVVDQPQRSSRY